MNIKENKVLLYELNELSTENSKTYAMSDGTKQTVTQGTVSVKTDG